MQDGITFCDSITETDESKAIKNSLQKTLTALNNHVNELTANITDGKGYKSPYSEQEIRRMQQFFNEQGTPYLKRQILLMRRRQKGRDW